VNQEVYRGHVDSHKGDCHRRWNALDPTMDHPLSCSGDEEQVAKQTQKEFQLSDEVIHIKDSCDVTVHTTDNKAAINLQAALQAAISIVLNIAIADNQKAEEIQQELFQSSKIKQITNQKTIVENSRNITVETTDNQVAVNLQILLQLLLALMVNLDIL